MKTVTVGNNVEVHYVGTFEDGTEFDNSHTRGATLDFEVGAGRMIKGFDQAVVGMTEGETKTVSLTPVDAYGERVEEAIQPVPMAAFGPDFKFELGEMIQGNGPQGSFVAKIQAIQEEQQQVILDMNHPLAGKTLNFEIQMVKIQ
tara:strand:+ start:191 stop:625 length:435 start_codon:yes stop_codon:yes gene_type:complete